MKLTAKSYILSVLLAGLISLLWLLLLPADSAKAWFLAYSRNRTLMIGILGAVLILLTWRYFTNPAFPAKISSKIRGRLKEQKNVHFSTDVLLAASLFGIVALSYPIYTSDEQFGGILVRLSPWLFFLTAACILSVCFLYAKDSNIATKSQDRQRLVERAVLFGMLFIFLTLNLGSIQNKSYTIDEPDHFRYGANLLNGSATRFDDSKMPFSALNAILPKILTQFTNAGPEIHLRVPISGRVFTILFSTSLVYFVYRWSRSIYGRLAGLLSAFVLIFDPNIIAHSRLVTTDIYATGMILLVTYTFWLFYKKKTWKYAWLSAITFGLAQIAKYTSAYLGPILLGIVFVLESPARIRDLKDRAYLRAWKKTLHGLRYFLFYAVVSLVIINIGFLFEDTFTPLKDYVFRSEMFQSIQEEFPGVGRIPVPVPYPYLEGLDWVKARERTGRGYGTNYLLGELRDADHFNGYFIIASLLKVPIATQILIFGAILKSLLKHQNGHFRRAELFLFAPTIFFFIYFNFFFRTQIGIRYYLVIFPFLYILCGNLAHNWSSARRIYKLSLISLSIYLIVSVLSAYPHYIPYFNELIGDQKNAHKYLADSNLDWHQSEPYLHQYLKQHPEAIYEPEAPIAGQIAVSPNVLVGVWAPEKFRWLRENFEPVDTIADVYLIYEIEQSELDILYNVK